MSRPTSGSTPNSARTNTITAAVTVCTTEEKAGELCVGCTAPRRRGSNPFPARTNWYRAITLWKDSTQANRLVSSNTLTMSRPTRPSVSSVVFVLRSPARDVAMTLMSMEDYLGYRIVARDPQLSRKTALRLMRGYAELATGATLPTTV